jgi:hypothetical protein
VVAKLNANVAVMIRHAKRMEVSETQVEIYRRKTPVAIVAHSEMVSISAELGRTF